MFSLNIGCLPACNTYQGAVRIWERARVPNSRNWPAGTRPLEDVRKTHYAVIKDGAKIVFRLHRTNVVEWHSEHRFTLDSNYDSISTRQFAERFMPSEVGFISMRENGCVVTLGEQKFLRGRHTFEKGHDHPWVCVSEMIKPKRRVLHPVLMREVQAATRETVEWVKGIWAVSGNNGHHPWVGQQIVKQTGRRFEIEDLKDPLVREEFVCSLIPTYRTRTASEGMKTFVGVADAKQLCTKINEHFYKQHDCYISIDYDAPIPRN